MDNSLLNRTDSFVLVLILFFVMIIVTVVGHKMRGPHHKELDELKGTMSTLLAALFALFGFILAFTFGMSGSRYDNIKNILIDEHNSIGTAIKRADLYSDSVRAEMRVNFKKYLEARVAYYDHYFEMQRASEEKSKAEKAINDIWDLAIKQSKLPNMLIPSNSMVPALNNLMDTADKRDLIGQARVPDLLLYMLFLLSVTISFIVGFTIPYFNRRAWFIILAFITVACLIIYVTLDFSRPLRGFVKADFGNQAIIQTLKDFHLDDEK